MKTTYDQAVIWAYLQFNRTVAIQHQLIIIIIINGMHTCRLIENRIQLRAANCNRSAKFTNGCAKNAMFSVNFQQTAAIHKRFVLIWKFRWFNCESTKKCKRNVLVPFGCLRARIIRNSCGFYLNQLHFFRIMLNLCELNYVIATAANTLRNKCTRINFGFFLLRQCRPKPQPKPPINHFNIHACIRFHMH